MGGSAPVLSYNPPRGPLRADTVSKLMRKVGAAAGVNTHARDGVSAHALRHTAARDVLDSGADVRHVQAMLGHRSLRTTPEYLRLNPPGLAEAMQGRTYRRDAS